jgi:hypothetical protein
MEESQLPRSGYFSYEPHLSEWALPMSKWSAQTTPGYFAVGREAPPMTLFEYTHTPHNMWVVTSPYIPELVTQASNKSEMYGRLAEAIKLVLKKRSERCEAFVLDREPRFLAQQSGSGETRELIRMMMRGNQIEFSSDEIPDFRSVTAYDPVDGIQKLSDVLSRLSGDEKPKMAEHA